MPKSIAGRRPNGTVKLKIFGNHFQKENVSKNTFSFHRKAGFHSEEIPVERVTLKATQTRMSKKSNKPSMPKMPWD